MDHVISFTPEQLIGAFLAFCVGFSSVCVAVGWIFKIRNAVKAPSKKVDERLTALEATVETYMTFFSNDKKRIDSIETGSRVTQKALLALLSHGIDGNDIDALKAAKVELQEYLIKKA